MKRNNIKIAANVWLMVALLMVSSCSNNNKLSDAYGNFEAVQVTVSAESAGRIHYLNVEEGSQPDSGAVVALVDTADLYLKKLQLQSQKKAIAVRKSSIESQVAVQQQQKQNLLVEKNRVSRLIADKAATAKQLDDINGAIDLVDKQMENINTQNAGIVEEMEIVDRQIAQVNESIRKCYIRNPVKGTVLNKFAEAGEVAAPGRALYKIADLSVMELKVYISGSQLPAVKQGQQVEVLIDKDQKTNRKLTGVVSWISPKAEFTPKIIQTKEERVNLVYGVKIRVPNDGSLKIAMPAEVNFTRVN
ncbi:MAG TPA: HlyD family efflux transporter periplasmic adaptor subunit [Bacteroidales bacterium]|nr:HlyD family efflux transporter periplasmic adaptor subunit [Bacteroidales bacterium]